MTEHLDPAAYAIVELAKNWAVNYSRAKSVFAHDIEALDWHPASTLGDGTPHGTSDDTPVERCVLDKEQIAADWGQCEDDRKMLAELLHSSNTVARRVADIARREKPDKIEVKMCDGKIAERKCENAASEHRVHDARDGTTTVYEGMCDQCWIASCSRCHQRPTMSGRTVEVEGRRVPACEACARKEWRERGGRVA